MRQGRAVRAIQRVQAYLNWRPTPVPPQFQSGAGMPSTNHYRLLPAGYNTPNYFMIDGTIIDRNLISPSIW
jgi:hypothetical protein